MMFVNTKGRRKRNDVFTFPLCTVTPIGCLGGSPTLLPPSSTPGSPEGKGLSHRGGPLCCTGLWALDGPRRSGGWPCKPALPGQQTRLVRAPKPHHWQTCGRDGCLLRSAFCQQGASGQLSLAAGADPVEPPRSAFLPGKEPLSLLLAAPVRTVIGWGSAGASPAQERSGPFPCEDAVPEPSEVTELRKASAPGPGPERAQALGHATATEPVLVRVACGQKSSSPQH